MGIHFSLVDFDELLALSRTPPIILNDMSVVTEEDRAALDRKTRTTYDNQDVINNIPSCECRTLTGGFMIGRTCPNCGTTVREVFDTTLEPRVWLRAPHGVEPLLSPVIWTMLSKEFTKQGFNLIEWLCNTDYTPPINRPVYEIEELLECGVQRGYNNFVKNFDAYIDILYSLKHFSRSKNEALLELLRRYRHRLFSQHLPLPNKSLLIIENTHFARYIDPKIQDVLDAMCNMQGIDTPLSTYTQRQRENRAAKTISKLANYYWDAYHEQLAKKPGLIRKHALGTRLHWSARAVITSNTRPHRYDELEIPWGQAIGIFDLHLKNKLLKQGMTPNEAIGFLKEHAVKYHPKLDEMFQELIAETKDRRGFKGVYVRNPSLTRASTQRMRVTKVKTDVNDQTTSLSILSVNGYNALASVTSVRWTRRAPSSVMVKG